MAVEHATLMVLKVDLECSSCFLKVKKVLANFPQIGDQVFDWKQNEVTISVICCDPEKIRDKLRSKAGKAIKNVNIKLPAKPKPKTVENSKDIEKPKAAQKPKEAQQPKEVKKAQELEKKVAFFEPEKPKMNTKIEKPKTDEKSTKTIIKPTKVDPSKTIESAPKPTIPDPVKMPGPVNGYPLQVYPQDVLPFATYCEQCYDGGPCFHGYGRPVLPTNGSIGIGIGYGYEYGYGGSRTVNANKLDYFSEENTLGCSIM